MEPIRDAKLRSPLSVPSASEHDSENSCIIISHSSPQAIESDINILQETGNSRNLTSFQEIDDNREREEFSVLDPSYHYKENEKFLGASKSIDPTNSSEPIATTYFREEDFKKEIDFSQFNCLLQHDLENVGSVEISSMKFGEIEGLSELFTLENMSSFEGGQFGLPSTHLASGHANLFDLTDACSKTPALKSQTKASTSASLVAKQPAKIRCTDCEPEYNPNCRKHNCQTCMQKVGSHNALICQRCDNAHHIACMASPLALRCCNACQPDREVPQNGSLIYTGKVPGILVGSSWKYRLQLCANYLHRPSMAGIHGAGEYPAYSIVLQGGYQSDEDHGMDFYYTGAGGRDDKGVHIKDQELGRSNLSLAASCDANLNPNGAEALDWTKSAPIRVIRGHLLKKHSPQYAPNALRYDGIYKLVRYWKEKIPEGFTIWRYHLRRDDDEPAPWTPEGKQYIIDNNIVFTDSEPLRRLRRTMPNSPYSTMRAPHSPLIVLEPFESFAQAEFEPQDQACIDTHLCDTPLNINFSPQRKHKMQDEVVTQETVVQLSEGGEDPELSNEVPALESEALKVLPPSPNPESGYRTFSSLEHLIRRDTRNQKLWENICSSSLQGVTQFLERVHNSFTCAVCFDLVESTAPYTTACGHNFCRPCFRASVRQNQGLCPKCKNHIPEDLLDEDNVPIAISSSSQALFNPALSEILIALKPGLDYYSATK